MMEDKQERRRRSFAASDEEYEEIKVLLKEAKKLTGKKAAESMIVALRMYNASVKKVLGGDVL